MIASQSRSCDDVVIADLDESKGEPEVAVEQVNMIVLIILDVMTPAEQLHRGILFFSISAAVLLDMVRGSRFPARVRGPSLRI